MDKCPCELFKVIFECLCHYLSYHDGVPFGSEHTV